MTDQTIRQRLEREIGVLVGKVHELSDALDTLTARNQQLEARVKELEKLSDGEAT